MYKISIFFFTLFLIAGCQSSPKSSETSDGSPKKIGEASEGGLFSSVFKGSSPKTIALPPDLVSKANDKVLENHNRAELEAGQAVLPAVIGAEVINQGGTRWLRVESDAQEVWDTLANFWAAEQVELVEFKPAAGVMETDWIEEGGKANKDASIVSRFFNRVIGQGTAFDKYKMRLEREKDSVTNIYVSHRFTEKKESNFSSPAKLTEWDWVEGDSDDEKIAQLLQFMVLLFETPEARQNS